MSVRVLIVAALLVLGVLAVLGLTPTIPQSITVVGFFLGASLLCIHLGRRRSA